MSFVFTAMLCKEQGITATAVCVLYEIFVVQKVNIVHYVYPSYDTKYLFVLTNCII